ncbi:hypothetical protein SAMN06296241_2498 [Salinimicrobium sediminis]|uniref:Helix-turn-helix domain-containing protein n=1 Tax=Salinimicrobium sediminis TaxID=1343891 RepID=A0A285X825_9FLAO|nr:helix-turn-helix domain-containing protein [Salinimicrobium sediminis]SOC80934.1 hypothetical protein SAMN06296241_2498 [Salinimicrobium sediminis]
MSQEKQWIPTKGIAQHLKQLKFEIPASSSRRSVSSEPLHPFVDRIESIENKLDLLLRIFSANGVYTARTLILDNADFIQLFKICAKTAQTWRDEGLIEYSQVKGKIFYRLEDVEKLLNRSRH